MGRVGQNHPGVQPGGLPREGGDQKALRLGMELLNGLDAATWLGCFRASGYKLPQDSRVGTELGGSGGGLGFTWGGVPNPISVMDW